MAANTDSTIAEMEGAAALPRKNGELVFEAPWEGRAFGLAVVLNESGRYPWRSFRDELVAQIADAEAHCVDSSYYERWLASLEEILIGQGLVSRAELDARTHEYASGERDD
jgi:nitrile hydratase accessory protein